MTENVLQKECPGLYCNVIKIDYDIPSGQKDGIYFQGKQFTAYLPDNQEGRDILRMLKIALSKKLTFDVIKNPNSQMNELMWGVIPHKSSLSGGEFGFPDPNYMQKLKETLNFLGIS